VGKRKECFIGAKFGRLTVVGDAKLIFRCGATQSQYLRAVPVCCDCGVAKEVWEHHLLAGRVKSCGCLRREASAKRFTTHGQRGTRLYSTWANMIARCERPSVSSYKYYGARGIGVCSAWHVFQAFYVWAIRHGYQDDLLLDRKKNDGGYCPSNCRWATALQQSLHRRLSLSKSGYIGVHKCSRNRYRSVICNKHLGCFVDSFSAVWVRDTYVKCNYDKYATLNNLKDRRLCKKRVTVDRRGTFDWEKVLNK